MVGVLNYADPVAGFCVSSAAAASATTAILVSRKYSIFKRIFSCSYAVFAPTNNVQKSVGSGATTTEPPTITPTSTTPPTTSPPSMWSDSSEKSYA